MRRAQQPNPYRKIELTLLAAMILVAALSSAAQVQQVGSSTPSTRKVLVSIPDRRLAVLSGDDVVATFDVAVGAASSPSPTGEFTIVSRVSNPTYYHPGTVIPAGKGNPLGTRWIGLSQRGYGIHGTNAPRSVGHARSHGCIRLRNRDVERLFSMLRVGDVVEIHGERDEQLAQVFGGGAEGTTLADAQILPAAGGQ